MKKHDIKHHLSKELLLAYSAGQLEEGFSLAIATHISMCDQCRAELEGLEAMGGAVFENLEPNEIDVDVCTAVAVSFLNPKLYPRPQFCEF